MSFRFSRPRGALLALLLLVAPSCTAKDNNATSVIPQGPPASTLASVRGTLIGVDGAPPKITIQVFLNGLTLQSAFTTLSEVSGRFSISDLPAGTYRIRFTPPTPDPSDPTTNLRTVEVGNVVVGADEIVIPPIFFAPVVNGGFTITDNDDNDQFLNVRMDPRDVTSAIVPGFEDMLFEVRAKTVLKQFGFTLAQLGIDDDTTSPTTRELLVEVAIVRGDQLPAPHFDANLDSRTSQAYYVLYPLGFDFLTAGTVTRELEVDFPNVNGLSSVFENSQLAYSFLTSTWEPAGVVDVTSNGLVVQADSFDGPKQLGVVVAPGPPAPTTIVTGQILNGGNPLLREGILVRTNSGFTGTTDSAGIYRIEDVPIPLHRADLPATAFTDSGLEVATASNVARPTYPTTTIDIELAAVPLLSPNCILANSEPITGSVGVQTNARIRIRFDGVMDRDSLQAAMTVVATPDGLATSSISGTVASKNVDVGGGILHTDAFFIADDPLPENASITVTVSTGATNENGLALTATCSFSYRTGTSTLFLPRIDVMDPEEGTVGQPVSIHGINMEIASLTFDGTNVAASSKTKTQLSFVVPSGEGNEAPGPRVLSLAPGGAADSFDILPRIDSIQFDNDPAIGVEDLIGIGSGAAGTSIAGVDQNDGTLVVINGQNLFDPGSGLMPLVVFGRSDGVIAGATDGDADIDGPDEAATELRIDVNVPPQATSGDLRVTVDIGGGMTFSSRPSTFVIDLPEDAGAPVFNTPNFVPAPGATGVLTSTIIRVEYNEALSGNSRLLVGSGAPLRQLPGETRVTTSLDGTTGFLEFIPSAGALPVSSAIQVQLSNALVFDLAGNPSSSFDYSFITGVTAPTGGVPDEIRDDIDTVVSPVESTLSEPEIATSPEPVDGERELVLRALGLGSAKRPVNDLSKDEPATKALVGIARLMFDSRISLDDKSVADWGELPPTGSWPVDASDNAAVQALFLADSWGYDADGNPRVVSYFRFDLAGSIPNPARHAYRFRISMADGRERVTGMITDLDTDGRYELSLFSDSETGLSALARTDLVQTGEGFIEFAFPAYTPPEVDGDGRTFSFFSVQSFDLVTSDYTNSPVIQFEY